jgi:hypothetical protein
MQTKKLFQLNRLGVGILMLILTSPKSPVYSRQSPMAWHSPAAIAQPAEKAENRFSRDPAPSAKKSSPGNHLPAVSSSKIARDKITSFFVHADNSKRIQFSILVVYKQEFADSVRKLLGEKVTPLLLSVSTLPNRTVRFEPSQFCFEQRGRLWQPDTAREAVDVWPIEAGEPFGGVLSHGQMQHGVILLPAWFDSRQPITVRYGDFHYLARFAQQ